MICLAGVMAALYVCLDFLAVSVSAPFGGTMKISISGLPVIIVAIFCGPWWGAATGFIGAFIGQLITYGISATTVLWVLPADRKSTRLNSSHYRPSRMPSSA